MLRKHANRLTPGEVPKNTRVLILLRAPHLQKRHTREILKTRKRRTALDKIIKTKTGNDLLWSGMAGKERTALPPQKKMSRKVLLS
ncbi:hypothetical protein BaRGS_00012686 [Batillaria attramentaria]|uniref:Uncharacterized protein n=1 Tax=Batillaria attramentaria TaxID=370345 RepID=A0ABD0L9W7_9CAEN